MTRMSPFYLMYGREARVPVALALGITDWDRTVEPKGYIKNLKEDLQLAHRLARENIAARHAIDAERRASKFTTMHFQLGEKVWLYWPPRIKPGQVKKFANRWHGPYEIINVNSDVDYTIKDLTGLRKKVIQVVHVGRIKPFTEGEAVQDTDAILWKQDSFDYRQEPGMRKLRLVVETVNEIPKEAVVMDDMPITDEDSTFGTVVEKGELTLPQEEDPGVDLDTIEGDVAEDSKPAWEITKILDERLGKYKTQYLVKWKGYPASWVDAEDMQAVDLVAEFHADKLLKKEKEGNKQKAAQSKFDEMIGMLTGIRTAWARRIPNLAQCRRALLGVLGRDSPLVKDVPLKNNLQKKIRELSTANKVVDLLNQCIDDAPIVFAVELDRIRESQNQKADLEPGAEPDSSSGQGQLP